MRNVPVDRLRRLDALRGIAAFVVVVNHAALAVPEAIRESLPSVSSPFLISGRFCVMVFFVLSGFVLTLPYVSGKAVSYGSYLVRRICRIYIPFAVAVLFSAVCCSLLDRPDMPMLSDWINSFWPQPVTSRLVAQQLAMTGFDGPSSITQNRSLPRIPPRCGEAAS